MSRKDKERVGILGGSFDPVHEGHLGLAREVRERFGLDRILFIPTHLSPYKQDQPVTPSSHRLEMLRLALRSEPSFSVSEIELERGGVSYTIDTVETLQARHPQTEFFLIMGMDVFKDIPAWKEASRLLGMCHMIVGTRPGFSMDRPAEMLKDLFPGASSPYSLVREKGGVYEFRHGETGRTLSIFELRPKDISSTEIRGRLQRKTRIKNLLPPEVEQYIIDHQLYQTQSHPLKD